MTQFSCHERETKDRRKENLFGSRENAGNGAKTQRERERERDVGGNLCRERKRVTWQNGGLSIRRRGEASNHLLRSVVFLSVLILFSHSFAFLLYYYYFIYIYTHTHARTHTIYYKIPESTRPVN